MTNYSIKRDSEISQSEEDTREKKVCQTDGEEAKEEDDSAETRGKV